ncbi:hypothetical protein [Herpetosiphon llansteffanensis]|uniref:hypothetical protein n=1 Tax=Herpetosiphon llansteffanensis TaxID=2094568 RepID=UPI000D7CEA32|nr:hypothetical protein [Herpetosiphon llansteffanensis]
MPYMISIIINLLNIEIKNDYISESLSIKKEDDCIQIKLEYYSNKEIPEFSTNDKRMLYFRETSDILEETILRVLSLVTRRSGYFNGSKHLMNGRNFGGNASFSSNSQALQIDMNKEHMLFFDKILMRAIDIENDYIENIQWYYRASLEKNSTTRFLYNWIGFNNLYKGIVKGNEKESIKKLVEGLDINLVKSIFIISEEHIKEISKKNILLKNGEDTTNGLRNTLLEEIKDNNYYKKNIISLSMVLYAIRNNLFHGSYRVYNKYHNEEIELGEQILMNIMRHIFIFNIILFEENLPLNISVFDIADLF